MRWVTGAERGPGAHREPPTHPGPCSQGCEDGCTLVPNNCFTVKTELLPFPLGIRIDYILYKVTGGPRPPAAGGREGRHRRHPPRPLAQAVSSFTVKCEELKTTTGTAPGMDIPFSDHEAVMATLRIRRQGQAAGANLGTAGKLGGGGVLLGPPMCPGGLVDGLMDISPCLGHPMGCCVWRGARTGQSGGDGEKKGCGGGGNPLELPLSPAEPTLVDVVTEARTEVGVGLRAAQRQRYSTGRMAVLALLLLLLQAAAALGALAGLAAEQPFPKLSFSLLAFLAIGVLLLATALHLFHTMEVKMLQGTEEQMRMALRALQERPSNS